MSKSTQWIAPVLTALVLCTATGASSGATTSPDRHERGYTWTRTEQVNLQQAASSRSTDPVHD
jgi:hypothetical protein